MASSCASVLRQLLLRGPAVRALPPTRPCSSWRRRRSRPCPAAHPSVCVVLVVEEAAQPSVHCRPPVCAVRLRGYGRCGRWEARQDADHDVDNVAVAAAPTFLEAWATFLAPPRWRFPKAASDVPAAAVGRGSGGGGGMDAIARQPGQRRRLPAGAVAAAAWTPPQGGRGSGGCCGPTMSCGIRTRQLGGAAARRPVPLGLLLEDGLGRQR